MPSYAVDQLGDRPARQRRVDREQVGHARLVLRVEDDLAAGVGHRRPDLLGRPRRVVEQLDDAVRRGRGLRHLRRRLLQIGDLRRVPDDVRLRHGQRRARTWC